VPLNAEEPAIGTGAGHRLDGAVRRSGQWREPVGEPVDALVVVAGHREVVGHCDAVRPWGVRKPDAVVHLLVHDLAVRLRHVLLE